LAYFRPSSAACTAALFVLGCAAGCAAEDKSMRAEVQGLRAEVRELARQNAATQRRLEDLQNKVDIIAARKAARLPAAKAEPAAVTEAASADVPKLDVVKMGPSTAPGAKRRPPPVPTQVPIVEPDPATLGALDQGASPDIAGDAEKELSEARRLEGAASARALEKFAHRYPRHPAADNALVDAARLFSRAGDADAACALLERAVREYPAADAMPDALEELGNCESQRGHKDKAEKLWQRVATDYPKTPAARRAGEKLSALR
jgi:TolA-binding protein